MPDDTIEDDPFGGGSNYYDVPLTNPKPFKRRYRFTKADCVRGGQARAAMADFGQICFMGFEEIAHRHDMKAALAIIRKRSGKRAKPQTGGGRAAKASNFLCTQETT